MKSEIHLQALDTHTEGMPTRIITGGLNESQFVDGTVAEQRDAFAEEHDELRELLMKEPRGHGDMFGAVPTTPASDEADLGLFFMDCGGYLDMCGHATMGVVTSFIETNQLAPESVVKIETPAGIVTAYPEITDEGDVKSVGVQNVTSYVIDTVTVTVDVQGERRELDADIVYAGNVFALVDTEQLGLPVETGHTQQFIEHGLAVRSAINEQCTIVDPTTGEETTVDLTEFYDANHDAHRNVVVFADGSIDRSPCGTGTCAKMTLLYSRGELDVEERFLHDSIIGTQFEGEIRDVETRNGVEITTPLVRGSAYIISDHTFVLDPVDPTPSFDLVEN